MSWRNDAVFMLAMLCGMTASVAQAQRGVGDPTGVVRQGANPHVVTIVGEVLKVETGPCENTTGRSPFGTHFIMKTKGGETLNIHLGPPAAVDFLIRELSAGTKVKVQGFRTEKMPKGHYVAKTVAYGDRTVDLRDASLQPVWAAAQGGRNTPPGPGAGYGWGCGRGAGYGYGRGRGYGAGYGRQRGFGPGWRSCPAVGDRNTESPDKTPRPPRSAAAASQDGAPKIAITATTPSLDAALEPQFGRCAYFLIVDIADGTMEAVENTSADHRGGAGVDSVRMIASKGVDLVLTGKCGAKAVDALAEKGIRVVTGCSGTIRDVIQQYKEGKLQLDAEPKLY